MSRRRLRLYVWEGVLRDYTEGIAFAVAESEPKARALIWKKLGYQLDQRIEPGLNGPATHTLELDSPCAFALYGGG